MMRAVDGSNMAAEEGGRVFGCAAEEEWEMKAKATFKVAAAAITRRVEGRYGSLTARDREII